MHLGDLVAWSRSAGRICSYAQVQDDTTAQKLYDSIDRGSNQLGDGQTHPQQRDGRQAIVCKHAM